MSLPSTFTKFVVVGGLGSSASPNSGQLGSFIARALLREGAEVTVLGRASATLTPTAKELTFLGATVKSVDYTSTESLREGLKGAEVVLSTLSGRGFEVQRTVAEAAKAGGVKLFVPSEFAEPTSHLGPSNPLYHKRVFQGQLRELGLPSTLFWSGVWADWVYPGIVGINAENKILIPSSGKPNVSFTFRDDAASFIAHVLAHSPPSTLLNATIPFESSRTSLLSLAHLLQRKNPSAEIIHVSHEELLKKWEANEDWLAWLSLQWDLGEGTVCREEGELKNGLWEGWQGKRVEEFLP